MKQTIALCFIVSVLCRTASCVGQHDADILSIGDPKSNILNKRNRDDFTFTVYPAPRPFHGQGKNVADEREWISHVNWASYGVESTADSTGISYISVDLKRPYFVRAFAVTGYALGGYKPSGPFFLEGSNDGNDWRMVAEGKPEQWHAPGTYPFRPSQIVKALYPEQYQYYRVIAKGWTNSKMLINNWGLFV